MNYGILFCIVLASFVASCHPEETIGALAKNYREEALKQAIVEYDQWAKSMGYTNATEAASLDGRKFKQCPICKRPGDDETGGIIVCFGCREVYWKEPIVCVWHVKFCPRCAKDTDARWGKGGVHLWEHFKLIFQRDFRESRWTTCSGTCK